MLKTFAILLISLLQAASVFAGSETSLCAKANLSSFRVDVSQGKFAPDARDFCRVKDADQPLELRQIIQQIFNLQTKLSQFMVDRYGIHQNQLTSKPIAIVLQGGPAGSMESTSSFPNLTLGVFKDWAGEPMDASNFIHEFTHLLMNDPVSSLPRSLRTTATLPLFSEQIPDSFAIAITGQALQTPELPACSVRAMHGDDQATSFLFPNRNFSGSHWVKGMQECCARESDFKQFPHFEEICELSRNAMRNVGPVCVIHASGKTENCSVHALGTPITTFITQLGLFLNKNEIEIYLSAFQTQKTPRAVFQLLRFKLERQAQRKFDQLWQEMGMDTALILAEHGKH